MFTVCSRAKVVYLKMVTRRTDHRPASSSPALISNMALAETAGAWFGCTQVPSGAPGGTNWQTPLAHSALLAHSRPLANRQILPGLHAVPDGQSRSVEQ